MTDALPLSDILTRGIVVEWYEGVALTRDIAERVLERPGATSVPELHQITLDRDGRIAVSGGSSTDEPVRRLGQLLQAALAPSDAPVQLRLIVAQATAPVPTFGSIREFTDALGHFERPDRQLALQTLYRRAASAAPQEPRVAATLDTVAPLSDAKPLSASTAARRARVRKIASIAAAAALAILALAVGYWKLGAGLSARQLSTTAIKASDAIGTAVVSGLSKVTERAGLGRLAPSDASVAPVPATATAPVPTPTANVSRKNRTVGVGARIPYQAYDLDPTKLPHSSAVAPAAVPATVPVSDSSPQNPEVEGTIYSSSDAVTPPVSLRPQLPGVLPASANVQQLARIELIVLPDGKVGSVKLLDHHNVHDAMFLSAVKAWEFKPAMKDGRPVTYRKTVWVAFH